MLSTCNGRNAQSFSCNRAQDGNLLEALCLISGWDELSSFGRVSCSCSTSGTHRIIHVKNPTITNIWR